MNSISQLEQDIKTLKIQGATDVALKVLEGLNLAYEKLKREKNHDPQVFLLEQSIRLAFARPTEPLAQNAVRFIFQKRESPQAYLQLALEYKKMIEASFNKIIEFGSNIIKTNGIYFTHCHSSSVTGIFQKAYKQGKKFKIFVTETRPRFQGRKTVSELLNAGLTDITMMIDTAAASLLLGSKQQFTAVILGADLLSESGFVNKIGTSAFCYIALQKNIPVFNASSLLKYDPRPYSDELVEKRESVEIWPDPPDNLKFLNPAFDFTPYSDNISIITEAGILKGNRIKSKALDLYPFLSSNLIKN